MGGPLRPDGPQGRDDVRQEEGILLLRGQPGGDEHLAEQDAAGAFFPRPELSEPVDHHLRHGRVLDASHHVQAR